MHNRNKENGDKDLGTLELERWKMDVCFGIGFFFCGGSVTAWTASLQRLEHPLGRVGAMAGKKSKKKKGGEKKKAKNKEKAKKPKEVWEELARNSKSAASELKFLGRNVIQDMFLELSDERKDDYPNQVPLPPQHTAPHPLLYPFPSWICTFLELCQKLVRLCAHRRWNTRFWLV